MRASSGCLEAWPEGCSEDGLAARSARLAQNRRHAGGREGVGGAEAGKVACLGVHPSGRHGLHAGQAADEGRVRATVEQGPRRAADLDEPGAAGKRSPGNAADDVEADAYRAMKGGETIDEAGEARRHVEELAVDRGFAVDRDGRDPVDFLGEIASDADPHAAPWRFVTRRPARVAVAALHSDGPQRPTSGRGSVAVPGNPPPEPSTAAKTIPAPPPRPDPGTAGQLPNGSTA
jgi:hypothetical protein